MKSIIESLAKEEQAILIVALFLLIYVGIMINVMVREYRTYLDDYPMCHFSLGDFIRRGRFYICLILGVVFITFVCLAVSLMAIRASASSGMPLPEVATTGVTIPARDSNRMASLICELL